MEWKDPQSIECSGFSMTINDQIREMSVRVNVRVLLATLGAAAAPGRRMCAYVYACIRMGLYVRIRVHRKGQGGIYRRRRWSTVDPPRKDHRVERSGDALPRKKR